MDAAEALAFITTRVDPASDPVLGINDLVGILILARGVDTNGNQPSAATWTPTYTIRGCYRAITEGWLIKHGRVVGRFDFTTDGQNFLRSQLLDHIEHQRRYWARKSQTSTSTLGATA